MGKHHRKHKKKSVAVSEFEEKKKIRESILKLFRARLTSPNHGGALVVGDSQNQESDGTKLPTKQPDKITAESKHRKRKKQDRTGARNTISPAGPSTDGSMSGLDRHRSKPVSKRKKYTKTSSRTKQVEKESAVSKHMKIAHGITYAPGRHGDTNIGAMSRVAHPRLTQKIGIINTGKKSAAVTRGIVIPEHINREAQEEIKKMVEDIDDSDQAKLDVAEHMVFSPNFSDGKLAASTPMSCNIPSTNAKCGSASSKKSDHSSVNKDGFPKVLPLWDTVGQILSPLKSVNRQMYPGRDYLKETTTELLKIYKQNAPRSVTPTPVPLLNKIVSSGSIQRSLLKFYSPPESHHSQDPYDNRRGQRDKNKDEKNSQAYSFNVHSPKLNFSDGNPFNQRDLLNQPSQSQLQQSSIDLHHRVDHDTSRNIASVFDAIDPRTSNRSIQRLPDEARELSNPTERQNVCVQAFTHGQENNPSKRGRCSGGDFTSFFYGQSEDNIFMARDVGHRSMPVSPVSGLDSQTLVQFSPLLCYEKMDVAESRKEDAEGMLKINETRTGQRLYFAPNGYSAGGDNLSVGNGSQCAHRSQSSSGSSQQVIRRRPEFMPSFHGNYYSDHMTSQDLVWPHISPALKMDGMDLLDLVDKDAQVDCRGDRRASSAHPVPGAQTHPSGSGAHPSGHGVQSHPTSHIARHKAPLHLSDDSPCDRTLYPRKMY